MVHLRLQRTPLGSPAPNDAVSDLSPLPATRRRILHPPHFTGDVLSPVEFPALPCRGRRQIDSNILPLPFNPDDVEIVPGIYLQIFRSSGCHSLDSTRDPRMASATVIPPEQRHTSSLQVGSDSNTRIYPNRTTTVTTEPPKINSNRRHRWMRKETVYLYFCYT